MLSITYESKATLFTNGAALFILAGMLANTTLYRKRGKSEDVLFFALIITDMISALFGSISVWFFELEVALPAALYLFIMTVFYSGYIVFGVLWCMYLMFRLGADKAKVRRKMPVICIPAIAIVLLYASSMFTHFIEWEGVGLWGLHISPYMIFTFVPVLVYGIITAVMTFGRHKRICILYGVLILVNGFFLMSLDVDVNALILSIYLIFAHLFAMRDPFYGEVTSL